MNPGTQPANAFIRTFGKPHRGTGHACDTVRCREVGWGGGGRRVRCSWRCSTTSWPRESQQVPSPPPPPPPPPHTHTHTTPGSHPASLGQEVHAATQEVASDLHDDRRPAPSPPSWHRAPSHSPCHHHPPRPALFAENFIVLDDAVRLCRCRRTSADRPSVSSDAGIVRRRAASVGSCQQACEPWTLTASSSMQSWSSSPPTARYLFGFVLLVLGVR
eukprot:COSAG04_NODE_998_length_8854_cov_3.254369_5_plen_217_part_00